MPSGTCSDAALATIAWAVTTEKAGFMAFPGLRVCDSSIHAHDTPERPTEHADIDDRRGALPIASRPRAGGRPDLYRTTDPGPDLVQQPNLRRGQKKRMDTPFETAENRDHHALVSPVGWA